MAWIDRIRNLIQRRELESGLDEELQFHLEARARDNVRDGMSPDEARRDAARRFGSQTLVKERTREADLLAPVEAVVRDIGYAIRSLRKTPGFTAIAVLTLALGIGANTAVFTVVNGVLLRPLPFPQAERLFLLTCIQKHNGFPDSQGMADDHYLNYRRANQSFASLATYNGYPMTLTGAGDPTRLPGTTVTSDFLSILRVRPVIGRAFSPEEAQAGHSPVVLISDRLWQSRFDADRGLVGRDIILDGVRRTVIGIMPPAFTFPSDSDFWIPLDVRLDPNNSYLRPVIGRLKDGVSPQQAQAALEGFAASERQDGKGLSGSILPLKESIVGDIRTSLLIFAGAVAFVLLIACANVANLLLIRASSRRQEITVRAALGASRWRLMRQLLIESTVVSLTGGVLGLVLACLIVPALLALAPAGKIPRAEQISLDSLVLAFTFGVSLMTGIIFGLAPAFQATRRELRESLNDGSRTSTGRHEKLRSGLVVSEIALALVLLTGAGLLVKSFIRIRSVDPGFRPENVITMTVDLPEARYRTATQMADFHRRTLERLSIVPGVQSAGLVNWMPLGQALIQGDFHLEDGRQLPPRFVVDKPVVSPSYFSAMGIRLRKGRTFLERDDATGPRVAIVSDSVIRRLWPNEDAVGKRIAIDDHPTPEDWVTIIGIVDDVRQAGLTAGTSPAVYLPYLQTKWPFFLAHMTFVLRTASPPLTVASGMRAVLQDVDKDQPAQTIATMESVVADTTAEPRFQARLLGAFSLLALVLSAIGIYGVLACSVAERTHEIGIRMALGASANEVVRMVLKRTFLLAAAGISVGAAGALAVTRVLAKFLFEIQPTDPGTFLSVAVLLAAVALFAGMLPARRASKVYPLVALRHE